jgi:hypothetical protein
MQALERTLAEAACARLLAAYAHAVDRYDHAAVIELFARDAVYESPSGVLRGRGAIAAYFERKDRRARGLHVYADVLIDVDDASHARGSSVVTFYSDPQPPAAGPSATAPPSVIARVHDRFVYEDAAWRFAHRAVEILFGRPVV